LIFFAYTLVRVARQERQTNWKSSQLALLFHGLDGETQQSYRGLDDLEEMEEKAKEVSAQLHTDDQGGWRLAATAK